MVTKTGAPLPEVRPLRGLGDAAGGGRGGRLGRAAGRVLAALLQGLQHVGVEVDDDELDKVLPVGEPALEEPHDDDVVCEGDGVGVELERVGEGEGDGEHGHVVRVGEAGEDLCGEKKCESKSGLGSFSA